MHSFGREGSEILFVFSFIMLFLIVYATMIEPYNLQVTKQRYTLINHTEQDQNPIKIVFISDIHASNAGEETVKKVVRLVNAQNPDIVLIGGDLVQGNNREWELLKSLQNISSKYGTYAVMGNHDYGLYVRDCRRDSVYTDRVELELERMNISVLRNEYSDINIRGQRFAIVGVDDYLACRNNYQKAIEGLPQTISRIVLVHQQEAVENVDFGKNALVLAGHTHCGQVRLPIIGSIPKLLWFKGDVDMGWGKLPSGQDIYVSCGTNPGMIRFLARPEVSVIEIK